MKEESIWLRVEVACGNGHRCFKFSRVSRIVMDVESGVGLSMKLSDSGIGRGGGLARGPASRRRRQCWILWNVVESGCVTAKRGARMVVWWGWGVGACRCRCSLLLGFALVLGGSDSDEMVPGLVVVSTESHQALSSAECTKVHVDSRALQAAVVHMALLLPACAAMLRDRPHSSRQDLEAGFS